MSDQANGTTQAAPTPGKSIIPAHILIDLKLLLVIVMIMLAAFIFFSVMILDRYEETRTNILPQSGQVEMTLVE
ncbi:MAG: hypothetical protein K8L99_27510 [Anaerolineae bacterium]|nr:hypothetical protein [Anaerolineae bacterium]